MACSCLPRPATGQTPNFAAYLAMTRDCLRGVAPLTSARARGSMERGRESPVALSHGPWPPAPRGRPL
eukprot:scaffold5046_cov403-Prasinococcus_capsulatus_cf.AAC.5